MVDPASASAWETWESVFLKTTALGDRIIEQTLYRGQHITRIAFVPHEGSIWPTSFLGCWACRVTKRSLWGYRSTTENTPMQAGDFKIGQLPDTSQVAGQVVL